MSESLGFCFTCKKSRLQLMAETSGFSMEYFLMVAIKLSILTFEPCEKEQKANRAKKKGTLIFCNILITISDAHSKVREKNDYDKQMGWVMQVV